MRLRLLPAMLLCAGAACAQTPTARLVLVGDSTMATRNGYGDALCQRLLPGVECWNLAMNGRSSGSFRAEGRWDAMLQRLKDGPAVPTWVLIQFGHNDQPGKPGRSTDLQTEYPANLARYVAEARAAGATPVLVTSLTRRSFKDGQLQNDLLPWAEAMQRVARQQGALLIDLNALSYQAVQAMGQAEADTLATEPPPSGPVAAANEGLAAKKSSFDRTHLGDKGAALFSGIVAGAMRATPALAALLRPE